MATLATESWTGANGAAWPAQWTTGAANTGVADIQGNQGRITSANVAYTPGAKAYLSGITATRDLDVVVDISFTAPSSEQYCYVMLRSADATAGNTPASGYVFQIQPHADGVNIGKQVGGVETDLNATDATTSGWTANVAKRFRFQAIGNTLRFREWAPGGTEPATWAATITDSSLSAATGKVYLQLGSGGDGVSRAVLFDNLTVTDGAAPAGTVAASLSGAGTLSATRTPGLTVSAALSGAGTLSATTTVGLTASAALSGSGTLTATATPTQVVNAALSGSGDLTAEVHNTRFVLFPPTREVPFRIEGGLMGLTSYGQSLWRIDGAWHLGFIPSAEQVAAADRFYGGGRVYALTSTERDDLVAAGYGAYITQEIT